jgi:hypothetical protein
MKIASLKLNLHNNICRDFKAAYATLRLNPFVDELRNREAAVVQDGAQDIDFLFF